MTSFADLIDAGILAIGDGYRAKNDELGQDGPIFLRSAYLQDNGWMLDAPDRLSNPIVAQFGPKVARQGDTVLTTKGNSLGRLGWASNEVVGSIYSPHLSYWRSLDMRRIEPRFLFYWAHSQQAQSQIKARSDQTDMAPYLSLGDQLSIEIELPSIESQVAIAEVLGSLDDKIELNRRMAETLGTMARALFKSWFVDFDPVHAKAEGRNANLHEDIDALFPATLNEDGLPEGWTTQTVGEMFEVSGGNTPSTAEPDNWDGSHQWATPRDLSSLSSPVLLWTERQITDSGLARSTSGLLPIGSLLLSSRAPIGYMAFATRPVAINQGFAGFVRKEVSTVYAWAWCATYMETIKGNAGGSTFPEISKSVLRGLPILRPSRSVLTAFEAAADPLIARMIGVVEEAATLAALRDVLLPRLISAELRIRDVEHAIVAA
jgi:type I restriction enzyme S subunit